jgi:sarcosine oxidase, subunit gamma
VTARSPLAVRSGDLDRQLGATELAFLSQLDVRTGPASAATLGFPTEPNTASTSGDRDVLWLGPDEWLIVGAAGAASAIREELEAPLAGPSRHDLLSSACPIDLHPRSWGDGRCAQSVFGAAQVLLHEREGATRLFVRPSFADYVVDLLLASVRP